MTTMAYQITSLTIVYATVYSGADQRKHQSSSSLTFMWGIHRDRYIPRTNGQYRGKCFHLMTSSCMSYYIPYKSTGPSGAVGSPPDTLIQCHIYIEKIKVFITHCNDVIMGAMAYQITSLTIVYASVYSGADQRKHQSSASLAFVRGIHRGPVNSPHKGPVTRRMFLFDVVIMKLFGKLLLFWSW